MRNRCCKFRILFQFNSILACFAQPKSCMDTDFISALRTLLRVSIIAFAMLMLTDCKAPEQTTRDTPALRTDTPPQDSILFLTITLKKDSLTKAVSAGLKDVLLVAGTMKKARVGGVGHSASRLLVSYLDAQGNVVDSTFEDNPLEPIHEFVNEQNQFEKQYIPVWEAYLPLRVQRREALSAVRLEHWAQADIKEPQKEAPVRRTLITTIPLRK